MMKKLLSVLLVCALLLPMAALAQETTFTELYSSELKTLDYLDSTLTALECAGSIVDDVKEGFMNVFESNDRSA